MATARAMTTAHVGGLSAQKDRMIVASPGLVRAAYPNVRVHTIAIT